MKVVEFVPESVSEETREFQQEVVEQLEKFLAEAREGKLGGIALAVSRHSETTTTYFRYGPVGGHKLTAATVMLFHNVMSHATGGD